MRFYTLRTADQVRLDHPDSIGKVRRLLQEAHCGEHRLLWVGEHHRLNEDEVRYLRDSLTRWLDSGTIATEDCLRRG